MAMPVFAQDARRTAVIWHDRGDPAMLDLVSGPGGKDGEPGADFTFVKEIETGTSPKFDVQDERGTRWKVKVGEEARSETAATRLLWAAGYVVDEDYYRQRIHVRGLPRLARGQEFVSAGDIVNGARLERDSESKDSKTWDWYDNPFVGTREFNGLRVMMALVNNWDLKAINNAATGLATGEGQYGITDLGATLGRTGNSLTRSKGVLKDYAESRFIDKVTPAYVDFGMHSRPFFVSLVNFRNYRFRTRMEGVVKRIPIADARWIGDRLGRLSPAQIRDAFSAAGFSPAEVDAYAQVLALRIEALQKLGDAPASAAGAPDTTERRCVASTCREVPLRETLTAIALKTVYAHAIVGGFDQGAGIGGGVQMSTANAIPAVQFRAAALTSSQQYRRYDLEAFLPNIGGGRNHADMWFSYLQRETDFFGIGPDTDLDLKTRFAIVQRSYQGSLYRDVADHLQAGVYAQSMSADTSLGTNAIVTFPGAVSNAQILSYGGFVAYDTRNNAVGLTRGLDLYARVASAGGIGRHDGLTSYGWLEQEFDARAFAPLGSPRTSLLLRSRAQFKTPADARHQIPFYDLSWLGGRQYLRGYHSYRFRGNNVALFSTELQQTVFAITGVRGVDLFASADAGQVWDDDFRPRSWHSGLGGGLQYRHSRAIAARIEASRSRERVVIYASLSRGF
jgi:hypothetical protein